MSTKVALVTGTTSGIGREVVRGLLERGYTVVAHGRSAEKAAAERESFAKSPGSERLHQVLADLSVKADVERLAAEVAAKFPKLELLIHNAAVIPKTRVETPDGLDAAFAANALAPFVLTRRLEGALKAAAPARVLFYYGGGDDVLDADDLQWKARPYSGFKVYSATKNACMLLMAEQAKRWAGTGVSLFGVLPGMVNTEGMRGLGFPFSLMAPLIMRTPAQGARTTLWVATETGLESKSGTCFGNVLGGGWKNETKLGSKASDPVLRAKVYAACEQLATA